MRKTLLIILFSCLLLFSACSDSSAYKKYENAYEMLEQVDSFATEYVEEAYYYWSEPDGEEVQIVEYISNQVCRSGDEYQAIGHMSMETIDDNSSSNATSGDLYICDGYQYNRTIDGSESISTRSACQPDFAFRIAVDGTIQFPKKVIAEMHIEDTSEGELLVFILDEEKYFDYRFPDIDEQTLLTAYGEPPIYTVLLDDEGRLKEATGHFYLVGKGEDPSVWKHQYSISFTQYGDIELDFSSLKRDDYMDLPETHD